MCPRVAQISILAVVLAILPAPSLAQQPVPVQKPRVVITADPELDDLNTLIRAILYSGDVQFEGLIYTSSGYHWKGDGKGTTQYIPGREYTRPALALGPQTEWRWAPDERFIDEVVDAYEKVYANLKVHDPSYPTPASLRSKIAWGNVMFDGDYSYDTAGSNLIKTLILDDLPGPLFVTAQGGQSTIARALKSIHDQYSKTPQWNAIREKVARKLVIVPSGDQDNAEPRYIRPNWPDVTYWRMGSGPSYGYGATGGSPENAVYVSPAWMREHVTSRGPLGELYRVWGDGKQMVKGDRTDYFGIEGLSADELRAKGYYVWTPPKPKGTFLGEGDTPTFINFIDIGLRATENGFWGGWGGRRRGDEFSAFGAAAETIAAGATKPVPPDYPGDGFGKAPAGSTANAPAPKAAAPTPSAASTIITGARPAVPPRTAAVNARFFAAAQNDFAARLKWSVTPNFKDANHEPSVGIVGPVDITAAPGATVTLEGVIADPDGNALTVRWWQHHDAGTYAGDVAIATPNAAETTVRVPADATAGQTIHVILEAQDDGMPSLTRYQRVVITVGR